MNIQHQSIDQFKTALLDFLRAQEYTGLSVIIIRDNGGVQHQITSCSNATDAACLLFDGASALALYYQGLK